MFHFSFVRTQCLPAALFRELLGVSSDSESHLEKFIDLINAVVNDVRLHGYAAMVLIYDSFY
jgi:hypothetical protein